MATGGEDLSHKVTCSVCLEPYRGRKPKILPCFHTFCLPCLEQIVNKETHNQQSAKVNDKALPVNLTCPTCRTVTPVPSGGVAYFQTNFYLDECPENKCVKAPPCNLCDGIHDARFCCSTCQKDFCPECRRYHDKLCTGVVWNHEPPAANKGRSSISADSTEGTCQEDDQLNVVEDALKKLGEQEEKLIWEKKSIEEDILARYMRALRHASEARDSAVSSLSAAVAELSDSLQQHRTQATQAKAALQNRPSSEPQSSVNACVAALAKLDTATSLQQCTSDNSAAVMNCLQCFIGTVTLHGTGNTSQGGQKSPAAIEKESGQSMKVCGAGSEDMEVIKQQLHDLTSKFTETNNLMSSYQQEVASLRDKYAILQHDFAELMSDNDKVHKQLAGISKVEADAEANQRDLGIALENMTSLQKSVKSQEGALAKNTSKISQLDRILGKKSTAVAFSVFLDRTVRTTTDRCIYMKDIVTNVGEGYDSHSGRFRPPVSGLYCLMATASPQKAGKECEAFIRIDIDDEGDCVGKLRCEDMATSSCQAIVHLAAGQTAWFESSSEECVFNGDGYTSFTGMLLQAD